MTPATYWRTCRASCAAIRPGRAWPLTFGFFLPRSLFSLTRSRSEQHLVHLRALLFRLGPLHMLRTSRLRVRSKPMDHGVLAVAVALIRISSAGSTTYDGHIWACLRWKTTVRRGSSGFSWICKRQFLTATTSEVVL